MVQLFVQRRAICHPVGVVPDVVEQETVIDAPVERVWALVTEPEHLGRWLADAGAEIDPRPEGKIVLRWLGAGDIRGQVMAVEPPSRFAFRWTPTDAPACTQGPVPDNSTIVEFTLSAEGDATRLRVAESGFTEQLHSEARQAESAEESREGWREELAHLHEYAQRSGV